MLRLAWFAIASKDAAAALIGGHFAIVMVYIMSGLISVKRRKAIGLEGDFMIFTQSDLNKLKGKPVEKAPVTDPAKAIRKKASKGYSVVKNKSGETVYPTRVKYNKVQYHLGTFKEEEEAARAYSDAVTSIKSGEFKHRLLFD